MSPYWEYEPLKALLAKKAEKLALDMGQARTNAVVASKLCSVIILDKSTASFT